jgi:rieske iron-sulfur protein
MKSKFSKGRRELLKSTGTLIGAAALVSAGGSLSAFAAGGSMPLPQAKGAPKKHDTFVFTKGPNKGKTVMVADVVLNAPPVMVLAVDPATGKPRQDEGSTDHASVLLYRVAPELVPQDMRNDTVDGIMAYSAVCTHQGCLITGWEAGKKLFECPCHDGLFDPMQEGDNVGGPKSRTLPHVPVISAEGKLEVSDQIVGWVGVKRGSYF